MYIQITKQNLKRLELTVFLDFVFLFKNAKLSTHKRYKK